MKRFISIMMTAILMFCLAVPTFAANQTKINVSASSAQAVPGDEIEITIAFAAQPADNISVMELVLPFDTSAFEYVEGSAKQVLPSLTGMTTGAAAYRERSGDMFCNWIDVQAAIPVSTTDIVSFKLKVTEYAKNTEYTFDLSDECFLTDADDNDIFFDTQAAKITVSGSPETKVEETSDAQNGTNNNTTLPADSEQTTPEAEADKDSKDGFAWEVILIIAAILVACGIVVVFAKKARGKNK
ncbi:MAG: hypothetical protein IJO48_01225 [Clostridia bacterium]|nr:hypothetical protein [Clostridia bacterium]